VAQDDARIFSVAAKVHITVAAIAIDRIFTIIEVFFLFISLRIEFSSILEG
jgi:hypothetical protein